MSAVAARLAGNRLHLQHGPIDVVIVAEGTAAAVERAYAAAARVFPDILPGLVTEVAVLRAPVGDWAKARHDRGGHDMLTSSVQGPTSVSQLVRGPVAQRMVAAVWPYRDQFITPMAAVAGAVAEAVLAAMIAAAPGLDRIIVNNGGDIAFHLADGRSVTAGIVADLAAPAIDATIRIGSDDVVRGIATSGWRGRSQSLGIADAVTVLASTAAVADAAATMIANAVNVDDPAIQRRPAREIKVDSDLGEHLVTIAVGPVSVKARQAALKAGQKYAEALVLNGRIAAACLSLQGETRVTGAIERARLPG